MKRCPTCSRFEPDNSLVYCRVDGAPLVINSSELSAEAGTAKLQASSGPTEIETSVLPHLTNPPVSRGTGPTTVLIPAAALTAGALAKPKRRKAGIVAVSIVVAAVALAFVVAGYFYYSRKSTTAIESIAVLPFENRSGTPDADYLSDGLAESLIYRLSQLPNLKVSPTSSVMHYKGKEKDVAKIAKELEVDAVMSGRLAQRGDQLTISVELIDAHTRKLLWAEQYERKMSELLVTQREIATEITNKLQLKLSGEGEQKLAKKYTTSDDAYQLYLKGRYHFAKRTKDDIPKGIEYFQQAIKLDPDFALAHASVAEAYGLMPAYPYLSPKKASPLARAAAKSALEIDPTLPEAHTALAQSLLTFDWKWGEAEREFKRALELNPNDSAAHWRYGMFFFMTLGRSDEAIAELKRALEIEPLSLPYNANLVLVYLFSGLREKALEQAKRTYDLEPSFVTGRYVLGLSYNANGMYEEAISLSEKSLQTDPTSQLMLRVSGDAYGRSGRRREAENVINKFREIARTEFVMSYFLASVYAGLGDKDKAFAELERAFVEHDWDLHRLKVDPFMNSLRDDSRFKEMLKRLNQPE